MMTSRALRIFLSVFVMTLMVANAAHASSAVFTVQGIEVDVTDENALLARQKAFEDAQMQAFQVLSERMLHSEQPGMLPQPDLQTIASMIKDYEVLEEKLSSVRYIGKYTVRFDGKAVQDYFSDLGINFTDVGSKPVLILPFYQLDNRTVLWSTRNEWYEAWKNHENKPGLVPIVVPIGDLMDVKDIGEDEALTYDEKGLTNMLRRYAAGEAVLVIAIPDPQFANSYDRSAGALSIHIYRTDRFGPEHVQKLIVTGRSGQTREQIWEQAVQRVRQSLQRDWKRKTVVEAGEESKLQVRVSFESLQEWAETQRALERVYGINEIVLHSLTPRQARIDLVFRGTERRLRLALQQADMTLTEPRISLASFGQDQKFRSLPLVYELYMDKYAPPDQQGF